MVSWWKAEQSLSAAQLECTLVSAGFTVFLERKIIGRLQGEQALQFHAANGYLSLVDTIHQIGETHNFTALVPDLSGGVDPDDSFSKVPYEKGFYFLYYLQVLPTSLCIHPFPPPCGPPPPFPPPSSTERTACTARKAQLACTACTAWLAQHRMQGKAVRMYFSTPDAAYMRCTGCCGKGRCLYA